MTLRESHGVALRDSDSVGKSKCSGGMDAQINLSPHFTIKQPALEEMLPQRPLDYHTLAWLLSERISNASSWQGRGWERSFLECLNTVL